LERLHDQEPVVLAHWIYTRDEWATFIKWFKRKQSFFHYLIHRATNFRSRQVPEVRITPERVWIGETHHHFNTEEHDLKRVNIKDEGKFNIMEISYQWNRSDLMNEIKIPVPKGKLKEAIEVEEKLNAIRLRQD
jgi:hypothetical protein